LDTVRKNLESVLIIKVTWQSHYARNDLVASPDFLSDLYIHTHSSRSSYGLCYAYTFGGNYNFFVSTLDRTKDNCCNSLLFDTHVLRNVSIEPIQTTLEISELLNRYRAVKK
jgi:hypothetical protein